MRDKLIISYVSIICADVLWHGATNITDPGSVMAAITYPLG